MFFLILVFANCVPVRDFEEGILLMCFSELRQVIIFVRFYTCFYVSPITNSLLYLIRIKVSKSAYTFLQYKKRA